MTKFLDSQVANDLYDVAAYAARTASKSDGIVTATIEKNGYDIPVVYLFVNNGTIAFSVSPSFAHNVCCFGFDSMNENYRRMYHGRNVESVKRSIRRQVAKYRA